jgi:hypothetical protein
MCREISTYRVDISLAVESSHNHDFLGRLPNQWSALKNLPTPEAPLRATSEYRANSVREAVERYELSQFLELLAVQLKWK